MKCNYTKVWLFIVVRSNVNVNKGQTDRILRARKIKRASLNFENGRGIV